ncbi:uncharacterized protein [Euphorbia lathyris]|uniref:uncharacterized protein isoform X2 n=1 Tax=Euphorbia lathyris TaxID=212925 RepID=UPI0033140E48
MEKWRKVDSPCHGIDYDRVISIYEWVNSPCHGSEFAGVTPALSWHCWIWFLRPSKFLPNLNSPHRRELPEELSRNVVVLTCESTVEGGSCDVYMIGTSHDKQESCKQIQAVIQSLKPQVVFLELCCQRMNLLTSQNAEVPTMGHMIESSKKKHLNLFGIFLVWSKAQAQCQVGVNCCEFRVACEEVIAYDGEICLGDRHQEITNGRAWARMHLWLKLKAIYLAFFTAKNPFWHKCTRGIFVHERDHEHSSVVAVVGKEHLEGIKKHWK